MKWLFCVLAFILSYGNCSLSRKVIKSPPTKRFEPTWESLDTRIAPTWFDEAKYGIFLHWGLYSVPGYGSEWFWTYWKQNKAEYARFMRNNYSPKFQYQDFASQFDATFFNPDALAELFENAGAKYIVITSKHHEGFTLWNSSFSWNWNSVDLNPHRNIIVELAAAVRKRNIKFCVYYSLLEWYNPLFMKDEEANYTTSYYAESHVIPQLKELVNLVKPDCLWADGDWFGSSDYWKTKEFLAWLYNDSPVKDTVLVNDRWGEDCSCKHGDFKNCHDDFRPTEPPKFKWEDAFTLDRQAWGHRHNINHQDVKSVAFVISTIIRTVSLGGNVLLNSGVSQKGTIEAIFQERFISVGVWLKRNKKAIYSTKVCPRKFENITSMVYYTCREKTIYAFSEILNRNNAEFCLTLAHVRPVQDLFTKSRAVILGLNEDAILKDDGKKITICLSLSSLLKVYQWEAVTFELQGFHFI